ncbi:MAG: type II toxin-antitoxin system VapC family toxin [Methanothrix sp.]
MIVIDTSVFIDLLFEYDSQRTRSSEELFSILEENALTIAEPDLFKVELTGQVARRVRKDKAEMICQEIFAELVFIDTPRIFEEALSIALETGSRASDSFYIACARMQKAILVSNDKYQIENARKSGIEVYNLLHEQKLVKGRLLEIAFQ